MNNNYPYEGAAGSYYDNQHYNDGYSSDRRYSSETITYFYGETDGEYNDVEAPSDDEGDDDRSGEEYSGDGPDYPEEGEDNSAEEEAEGEAEEEEEEEEEEELHLYEEQHRSNGDRNHFAPYPALTYQDGYANLYVHTSDSNDSSNESSYEYGDDDYD